METLERPTFQTEAGKEIYQYVERHVAEDLTYTIRPARHDDFEPLIDTIRDVTDTSDYVVAETVAEQLLYEDTVNRHNTVESRVFFVAVHDDDVIGWVHLDLPQLEKLKNTAQVTDGGRDALPGAP